MGSIFQLVGAYHVDPAGMTASLGEPSMPTPLDERVLLIRKHYDEITLTADAVTTVGMGGITNAHVLVAKVPGGKVVMRITTADGATQSIPIEELLVLISLSRPVTAIDLRRESGIVTTVKLFLGEKV